MYSNFNIWLDFHTNECFTMTESHQFARPQSTNLSGGDPSSLVSCTCGWRSSACHGRVFDLVEWMLSVFHSQTSTLAASTQLPISHTCYFSNFNRVDYPPCPSSNFWNIQLLLFLTVPTSIFINVPILDFSTPRPFPGFWFFLAEVATARAPPPAIVCKQSINLSITEVIL